MEIEKARKIINNRPLALVLHGNSINELESRIKEFKDLDICWASLGQWDLVENYILNKINKKLDITFDSATVAKPVRFEILKRIPRLKEFLERPGDNCHITMRHPSIHDLRKKIGCDLEDKYANKIIYAEDICPAHAFCVSFPLAITSLWVLGAKNIILFGCDGSLDNSVTSYFHYEEVLIEKRISGNEEEFNLSGDCGWVASAFPKVLSHIAKEKGLEPPQIINCSTKSIHNLWEKVTYEEGINWIKEKSKWEYQ